MGSTEFLMKGIETIVVSNFPMDIIVHAFLESSVVREIANYKRSPSLNYHISQLEAKLIYFLYIYFSYSYIDEQNLTQDNLLNIWSTILKSIRPFCISKAPTTAMWILDFISMCSLKYSPK